jgi:hypothetical protein
LIKSFSDGGTPHIERAGTVAYPRAPLKVIRILGYLGRGETLTAHIFAAENEYEY